MGKHKLDEATEEILQHYGIKGMKWDVIRTDEQIAAANGKSESAASSSGGGNEDAEGFLEEFGDTVAKAVDAIGETIDDIGDSVKKKGMKLLTGIFGKSEVKIGKATPNKKATDTIRKGMMEYANASPEKRKKLKAGIQTSTQTTRNGSRQTTTTITKKAGPLGIPIKETRKVTTYTND